MTTPAITVGPETSPKEAAALLVRRKISAVPVVDGAGDLVGIVSEADLVQLETAPDRVPDAVREVMTRHVWTTPPEADAAEVARLMLEKRIRSVPIVEGNHIVGIVARRDLLRVIARTDAEIRADVQELLAEEILMPDRLDIRVADGVVTLMGSTDSGRWRMAELLALSVAGVVGVEVVETSP
jgi:predicted transcriptional regulator